MTLLAIDGNSILNRAFYGIKMLSSKKGIFTNAVFGFMNIYLKAVEEVKPDFIAVAFDLRAPTFRHKQVASYKANRKGMPDELAAQLPIVKQLLADMGVKTVEIEGFEADDVLGTLSSACCSQGHKCVVLTGDRDSLQLINECVTVRLATTKETIVYDEERFLADYGFKPILLIDLKSLMGDSSDNIKGVAGVGEKTAKKLVAQWGDVENIYANLDKAGLSAGVTAKLVAGHESALESKWLATIKLDVPVETDISAYKPALMDTEAVRKLLSGLEMFSLLDRLKLEAVEIPAEEEPERKVQPLAELTVSDMTEVDLIRLVQLKEPVCYTHEGNILRVIDGNHIYITDNTSFIIDFLQSFVHKITFSAKKDYRLCLENKFELKNMDFDLEIAAYLLNPSSSEYTIERLCGEYSTPYRSDMSENSAIASVPELYQKLKDEIFQIGSDKLMNEIELPLTEVLASMEYCGVRVDTDGVRDFGTMLSSELSGIQERIYEYAGCEFNISSPKQLGEVLFEKLGLPAKKKTKTGYSTNAEVLEDLRTKHPVIELILQYRQLFKLNSTYVEGLLKTVAKDGRIHTSFKQTETRTGRISSTEPNMQNIPVRTDIGKNMRKFFIASDGKILLDADYSQIELRILAYLCGDENMKKAFESGADIHTSTAAQVFKMPVDMVTPAMRSYAKAVNFGIIYGIGAFSLSKDIGVSISEADAYIKSYLSHYPKVAEFMNKTVEDAKANGYVTTFLGRRRYIPELASSNKILQAAGRRIAMNTPIQGAAADIIKIAMVKVYNRLKAENLSAKLILQVHDELIIEADESCADKAAEILKEEMQNACRLNVPLTVDVNKGKSWYDAKG